MMNIQPTSFSISSYNEHKILTYLDHVFTLRLYGTNIHNILFSVKTTFKLMELISFFLFLH